MSEKAWAIAYDGGGILVWTVQRTRREAKETWEKWAGVSIKDYPLYKPVRVVVDLALPASQPASD